MVLEVLAFVLSKTRELLQCTPFLPKLVTELRQPRHQGFSAARPFPGDN